MLGSEERQSERCEQPVAREVARSAMSGYPHRRPARGVEAGQRNSVGVGDPSVPVDPQAALCVKQRGPYPDRGERPGECMLGPESAPPRIGAGAARDLLDFGDRSGEGLSGDSERGGELLGPSAQRSAPISTVCRKSSKRTQRSCMRRSMTIAAQASGWAISSFANSE